MSIGEKFATRNEVETLRRKLEMALSGAKLIQVATVSPDIENIENFIDLTDVPPSYVAAGNFAVRVKSTEDQLEFAELKGTTNQVYITPHAADYVFSLPQDIHTAATPTFAGMYLTSASAAPFLKLTNESDTERDPIHQMAVGATPVVKWTWGLDDSDADKWKLSNSALLGAVTVKVLSFGDTIYYTHGLDDVHGVALSDFTTDTVYIVGGTGSGDGQFDHPKQIAYDGTYIYIADDGNDRVQKFLAFDGSFVSKTTTNLTRPWGCVYWNGSIYVSSYSTTYANTIRKFDAETMEFQSKFGSAGAGNDQFNQPRSMTTDGTCLYICDYGNDRIKKHTLSGTYVGQVGSTGTGNGEFNGPMGIATDGVLLYVCDYGNNRIQIFQCSDLAYVDQVAMQVRSGTAGFPTSATINGTHFYVTCKHAPPLCAYIEKYDIATRTYQAFHDPIGNADDSYGCIILKALLSYGDLLIVHQDGQYFDIYPKTRFFDWIRLYESDVETGEYIGLRTPVDVTTSYHLTLPAAPNTAKSHVYADAGAVLAWGQNVDTDGSPTFITVKLKTSLQFEETGAGTDLITLQAPASIAASYTLTLPTTDSTGIQALVSNGAGILSWSALGGSLALGDLTDVYFPSGEPDIGDVLTYESGGWTSMPPLEYFTELLDVPNAYAGAGGFVVKVKGDASGLEFVAGGAGVSSFNDLDDVPASYVGQEGLFVKVNGTADGLEYGAGSAGAPTDAQYVTLATDAGLSDERVLTEGPGIKLTDAGVGSTITVAPNFDVVHRQDWIHEHFDGLNTATIIGQGSYNEAGAWIDDGMAAGSTALVTVKAGADKMLTITNKGAAGATSSYISSMITTKTFLNGGGYVHAKAKVNQDGVGYGGRIFTIMDGTGGVGGQPFSIYFRYSTTFQIAFWNGAGTKIQDCAKNTWYTIDAYWGPTGTAAGVVAIFIDGAWAYKGAVGTMSTKWDRVSISSYSPAGGNDCVMDVDDLIVSSIMPLGISY